MFFSLKNCPDYVPPQRGHPLYKTNPCCGLKWKQGGTALSGKTLRTQCTQADDDGRRCVNSTTFDYRFCFRHLLENFHLMVCPTSIPGLKGWGLYAMDPRRVQLDATRRPVQNKSVVVFTRGQIIGGRHCAFVGELIDEQEAEVRYPSGLCGDYVLEGELPDTFLDGQVARTVLQFSNDAINLGDPQKRRNLPGQICMPDWPVVQNAVGVKIGRKIYLQALTNITHGEEIYWSYSGEGDTAEEHDYWSAPNHS